MIEVKVNNAGIILAAICIYIYYFSNLFLPGMYAVFDVLTKNYATRKITYVDSYITNNWFIAKSYYASADNKKNIGANYHLKVLLADQKGKSVYSSAYFHTMEKGKNYTVTYGKKSKILISVLSPQGEEMLQFDVD
jgi:hypothetical protein